MAQSTASTYRICDSCKQPIIGPVVGGIGKVWHPNHFVCAECHKPLSGNRFNHKDGKPYCEEDYIKLFSHRCAKCQQPIREQMILAMGKHWHREHFVCTKCETPLAGQQFCEHDGAPYCQKDFNDLFAPKCFGCKMPITGMSIVALGHNWHQSCFKCSKCGKPITDNMFQVINDQPVCVTCSGKDKPRI